MPVIIKGARLDDGRIFNKKKIKKKIMANLGYILKQSVMDASESLSSDDFSKLIKGLFNYAVYGEIPEFDGILKAIYEMEKPAIDYNNKKWQENSAKYKAMKNGSYGSF